MDKTIKFGLIGLGPRGKSLLKTLIESKNPSVEIFAVCDQSSQKLDDFKDWLENEHGIYGVKYYKDYEDMLEYSGVEAVIVATNVETHAMISAACINAGVHTICEIPIINNYDDARKLITAVRNNPEVKFMVAENCCYWAFIESWKSMYESGLLGDVVMAEADYIHRSKLMDTPDKKDVVFTWRSFLPAIHYPTHDLGPLLYIMDDVCTEITGFEPELHPLKKVRPANPNGMLIAKTKKGAIIKIFVGFGIHRTQGGHNFVIYGTKGSVENERIGSHDTRETFADLAAIPNTHSSLHIPVTTGNSSAAHGGGDMRMLNDFVDCLVKDRKPKLDLEYGINISIPGLLAHLSAEQGGKPFKMPTIDEIMEGKTDPVL